MNFQFSFKLQPKTPQKTSNKLHHKLTSQLSHFNSSFTKDGNKLSFFQNTTRKYSTKTSNVLENNAIEAPIDARKFARVGNSSSLFI